MGGEHEIRTKPNVEINKVEYKNVCLTIVTYIKKSHFPTMEIHEENEDYYIRLFDNDSKRIKSAEFVLPKDPYKLQMWWHINNCYSDIATNACIAMIKTFPGTFSYEFDDRQDSFTSSDYSYGTRFTSEEERNLRDRFNC